MACSTGFGGFLKDKTSSGFGTKMCINRVPSLQSGNPLLGRGVLSCIHMSSLVCFLPLRAVEEWKALRKNGRRTYENSRIDPSSAATRKLEKPKTLNQLCTTPGGIRTPLVAISFLMPAEITIVAARIIQRRVCSPMV